MAHANPGAHLIGKSLIPPVPREEEEGVSVVRSRSMAHTGADTPSEGESKKAVSESTPDKGQKKTRADRAEEWLENLYDYHVWHPRFTRILVLIVGLGLILFVGVLIYRQLVKAPAVEPLYTKVEGIKQLGRLRLVRHLYESVIPITKNKLDRHEAIKKQQLQFLLTAPIEIYGYIDLGQVKLDVKARDSLVILTLPRAEHSPPYLDLANTEEFLMEGKRRLFGGYLEFTDHVKAYRDIVSGLNESKQKVIERAIANGLLTETEEKAAIFLRGFVRNLGYKRVDIQFVPDPNERSGTSADSTSMMDRVKDAGQAALDKVRGN